MIKLAKLYNKIIKVVAHLERPLASDAGGAFLIVAIIVTVVVLGTITALQFQVSGKNLNESVMQNVDMQLLDVQLDNVLKNENSCRLALGGPLTYGGSLTGREQKFDPTFGVTTSLTFYKSDGTVWLAPTPYVEGNCGALPSSCFGKLAITALNVTPVTGSALPNPLGGLPVYFAQLTIKAVKPSTSLLGGQNLARSDIYLTLQLDGSKNIVSCTSLTFLGTDSLPSPLPICAKNYALSSNGKQIRCVKSVCDAGQTILTYAGNGDVVCSP